MKKRSQVAAEFVLLVMLGFMAMIVFAAFARNQATDLKNDRVYSALKDVGYSIQREVLIAAETIDGYERNFTIPSLIENTPYNITKENGYMSASTEGFEILLRIPSTNGTFKFNNNQIKKQGGVIYLNP